MLIGKTLFTGKSFSMSNADAAWHLHLPLIGDPRQELVLLNVINDAIENGRSVIVQGVDGSRRDEIIRAAERAGRIDDVVEVWSGQGEVEGGHQYLSALRFDDEHEQERLTTVLPFSLRRHGSVPVAMGLVLHTVENYINWSRSIGRNQFGLQDVEFLAGVDGLKKMVTDDGGEVPLYITEFVRKYLQGIENGGIDLGDGVIVTAAKHASMVSQLAEIIARLSGGLRVSIEGFSVAQALNKNLICLVREMEPALMDFGLADIDHAVSRRVMARVGADAAGSWRVSKAKENEDATLLVLTETSWIKSRKRYVRFEGECARADVTLVLPTRDQKLPDLLEDTDSGHRLIPINVCEPGPFGSVRVRGARWGYRKSGWFSALRHPTISRWSKVLQPDPSVGLCGKR